jgi:hypothetical protein
MNCAEKSSYSLKVLFSRVGGNIWTVMVKIYDNV